MMKAVIQRVNQGSVSVGGEIVAERKRTPPFKRKTQA